MDIEKASCVFISQEKSETIDTISVVDLIKSPSCSKTEIKQRITFFVVSFSYHIICVVVDVVVAVNHPSH